MLHDIMPETENHLNEKKTTGYIGFDPTADSLHIGSLVQIIILMHFQKAGHRPIALVGGATGMIGDPSGKSAERNLLNEQTLNKNIQGIKSQLSRFLDFDQNSENPALLVNNFDWMKGYSLIDFSRDIGKHITVNYMMSKDSVKKRLGSESQVGMSFTEFTYQLLQGYDFLHLYKNLDCTLQMGGSDQWGNITSGTELIRKKTGKKVFALTCPLITKTDGTKFGKTESGTIWLDPQKTSPYAFYQFWVNTADADVYTFLRYFTFLDVAEIEAIGPLLILHNWPWLLRNALWIHFIDNNGALGALVNGSSSVESQEIITGSTWQLVAQLETLPWFDRVDSSSNPVDGLSRKDFSGNWSWREITFPSTVLRSLTSSLS